MADSTKVRVAVLESSYVSLEDLGVPLSVCLHLQQHRLQLHQAQWTVRKSTAGFSVSFVWPALEANNQVKKAKNRKLKKKFQPNNVPTINAAIHQKPSDLQKEADIVREHQESKKTPVVAHHSQSPLRSTTARSDSPCSSRNLPLTDSCQSPDLFKCQDILYESRNSIPGVSYTTPDGKDEWTPVKRRRKMRRRSIERESSSASGSEVDVSCARVVEKHKGTPGLKVSRRGPDTWIPIKAAKPEPVAFRTRSKYKWLYVYIRYLLYMFNRLLFRYS